MYPDRRHEGHPQSIEHRAGTRAVGSILLAAGILAAQCAQGQVSASASLASEYTVRGISLSEGRPAPQLSIGYDAAPGWYAGAFVSRVALRDNGARAEAIAYGGYARRMPSGLSWEAGASSTVFLHGPEYNYREVYAGIASDRLSGRLYLAPAYYGYGGRVAYAELNGFYPLRERIKLVVHVGVLHGLHGQAGGRARIDARVAIGVDLGDCNVQLAWLGRAGDGPGPGRGGGRAPRALALNASIAF